MRPKHPALCALFTALSLFTFGDAVAELEVEAPTHVADNVRAHLSLAKEACDARKLTALNRNLSDAGFYGRVDVHP